MNKVVIEVKVMKVFVQVCTIKNNSGCGVFKTLTHVFINCSLVKTGLENGD